MTISINILPPQTSMGDPIRTPHHNMVDIYGHTRMAFIIPCIALDESSFNQTREFLRAIHYYMLLLVMTSGGSASHEWIYHLSTSVSASSRIVRATGSSFCPPTKCTTAEAPKPWSKLMAYPKATRGYTRK